MAGKKRERVEALDRDLTSYELEKWLTLSHFLIQRPSVRDSLFHRILLKSLREVDRHRRFINRMTAEAGDILDKTSYRSPEVTRDAVKALLGYFEQPVAKNEEVPVLTAQQDPAVMAEMQKLDAIERINEKFLRPKGLTLTLHYPDNGAKPITVTLDKWDIR